MNSIFRYAIGLSVATLVGGVVVDQAQALTTTGSLAFTNGTLDFFSEVNPGVGDMFDVTFNPPPGEVVLVNSASGDFLSPFSPGFNLEGVSAYTATFTYVGDSGSNFIYELSNDLTFDFDNGAIITWLAGTKFEGMFQNVGVNSVVFNSLDPEMATVINIGDEVMVVNSFVQFSDTQISTPGTFNVSVDVAAVPEPLTILGAGTAIAFGTGFKRKLGKAKKK